jgi:nicotinamidase-related amidase
MPRPALIVVDMLNRYEHEDAEPLRDAVRTVLPTMSDLIARVSEGGALGLRQ